MSIHPCEHCGQPFTRGDHGPGQGRRFCSDNCRKRAHERLFVACPRCGVPRRMDRRSSHCWACEVAARRQRASARREHIVRRWREGASLRQIAAELGSTANTIGVDIMRLRAEGIDLPYRRRKRRPWKG